jgi:hypothetical protein
VDNAGRCGSSSDPILWCTLNTDLMMIQVSYRRSCDIETFKGTNPKDKNPAKVVTSETSR